MLRYAQREYYTPMAKKLETRIVQNIMRYMSQHYAFDGYHVHGSLLQRNGEPDIDGSLWSDVLGRWVHLKVEVKTSTGEPTKLQLTRLRAYFRRGYLVGVVTSVEDMMLIVRAYEEYHYNTVEVMDKAVPTVSYTHAALVVGLLDPYGLYTGV